MPYSLLVCDLDGTLIDHTLLLAPELVGAFLRASEAGLRISIATGRMPAATVRYRDELMIRAPVIYYNGALVRDTLSGDDLLSVTLPRGVLRQAYDVFAHSPVHPLFYRDDQLYCLEQSLPVRGYCDEEGLRAEVIPDPSDFLSLGAFVKSLLIGHPEALPVVREELERVIAVGDQENDLEMIQAAGMGVAMPHAPELVRAAADRVAPAPEAGGLLALFRELIPEYFA